MVGDDISISILESLSRWLRRSVHLLSGDSKGTRTGLTRQSFRARRRLQGYCENGNGSVDTMRRSAERATSGNQCMVDSVSSSEVDPSTEGNV